MEYLDRAFERFGYGCVWLADCVIPSLLVTPPRFSVLSYSDEPIIIGMFSLYWTLLEALPILRFALSLHTQLEMFTTVFLACADDGIGRVDTSMLSQQSLMELFIFGLDEVEDICGSRDEPSEVCTWTGVTCNADGEVEKFRWATNFDYGSGTISLESLPCSVKNLNMSCNTLVANPTKGHLSVVGWTSTPVLGEAKNLFKPLVVFLSWRRPY